MKRRDFITLIGSAAAAWPLMAHAQQKRVHQIGILTPFKESDPGSATFIAAFVRALGDLGWTEGSNLKTHVRWAGGSVEQARTYAKELVSLKPDAILGRFDSADCGTSKGDFYDTDYICRSIRSGWLRICCEPFAPRREYYWVWKPGTFAGREVAGTAHRTRAQRQAGCRHLQS